jgi:ankyrin repeat protein
MSIKQFTAGTGFFVLCFLIGNGPASAVTDNDLGLIEASARGDLRIFKMMLEMGANPDAVDKGGNNAVLVAAYYSHRDMVRRLIELHANVNVKGSIGYAPIGAAAMRKDREILKMLIKAGAKIDDLDYLEESPLANAVRFQRDENVRLLLEAGADVDRAGSRGETPLVLAIQNGRFDYMNELLAKGADVNLSVANMYGERGTALYWAISAGREEMALRLIQSGANVVYPINGYTPLHWAKVSNMPLVVSQLLKMGVAD